MTAKRQASIEKNAAKVADIQSKLSQGAWVVEVDTDVLSVKPTHAAASVTAWSESASVSLLLFVENGKIQSIEGLDTEDNFEFELDEQDLDQVSWDLVRTVGLVKQMIEDEYGE